MTTKANQLNMEKKQYVHFLGKLFCIELSRTAIRALQYEKTPLLVDMQLIFGCLVRKQVSFLNNDPEQRFTPVTEKLSLAFNSIISQSCQIGESVQSTEHIPSKSIQNFVPTWLRIDYHKGAWQGKYGF